MTKTEQFLKADLLKAQARNLTYNGSKEEAIRKHRLNEEAMKLETKAIAASVRSMNSMA